MTSASVHRYLLNDNFIVIERPSEQKFEAVTRVRCRSELLAMDLEIDLHSELFPVEVGDKFAMALASSLLPNKPDTGEYDPHMGTSNERSLANDFEYVMYGRVYKFDPEGANLVSVYVSFGGLLMKLMGNPEHVIDIRPNTTLYLLMRHL